MDNKIVTARFATDDNYVNVYDVYQWDYGQVLRIEGLKLPNMVEIHFSLQETSGEAKTRIGVTKDGVTDVVIPDSFLENEGIGDKYKIFAWVYVADKDSGSTEYKITIHIKARAKPEISHGGQDGEVFQEAVEAVRDAAARAAESEKQAEGWAHGREDLPERAEDNAKYYAGKTSEDAQRAATDRKEVERLTESNTQIQGEVAKDLEEVKKLSSQAQTSATNAALSEQKSEEAATRAETAQAGAETAENNAELAAQKTGQDKTAVEQAKKLVQQMGQEVLDNKNTVDKTVQDFNLTAQQALADINNAGQTQTERVQSAGNTAVENIKTAQNTATRAVETAKSEAIKVVQTEGTIQTGAVTTEGEKQVQAVQTAAQEIIADREKIQKNKTDIADLRQGKADAIIESVSGTLLNVKDSSGAYFEDFSMSGKTTQDGTPTPDTPVEIVNAGRLNSDTGKYEIDVKITGKNLIDEKEIYRTDLNYFISDKRYGGKGIDLKAGTSYTFSVNKNVDGLYIHLYTNTDEALTKVYGQQKLTYTPENDMKVQLLIFRMDGIIEGTTAQLEEGAVATDHETYREPQTITLSLDRPLTKWDRLTEQDGQIGWLYKGKQYIVTGEESLRIPVDLPSYIYGNTTSSFLTISNNDFSDKKGYLNKLPYIPEVWTSQSNKEGYCLNITNQLHVRFANTRLNIENTASISEREKAIKAHIKQQYDAGTPYVLWYESLQEEFVPLPQEQQDAIRALHTNYPTTIVSNSEDTEMQLTYIADTKNYHLGREEILQKQILEIQNALISQKISGGGIIQVKDSAKLPLVKLSVFGKFEQTTTTGAQLLNYYKLAKLYPQYYSIEQGELKVNNSDNSAWSSVPEYGTLAAGTYTISGTNVEIRDASKNTVIATCIGDTFSKFTLNEDAAIKIKVGYGLDKYPIVAKAMLNKGDSKKTYEPYTGGKPSPSTEYPQEITSAGDKGTIEIKVTGKNLIPFPYPAISGNKGTKNGITWEVLADGGIRLQGTASTAFYLDLDNNLKIGDTLIAPGNTDGKIAVNKDVTYNGNIAKAYIAVGKGMTVNRVYYPQIEYGTISTSYEPYREPQELTLLTPNGLPGLKVDSGGNYTDQDGQQWVADEIDSARGKYVQRIKERIFDGTETWNVTRENTYSLFHWANDKEHGYVQNDKKYYLCSSAKIVTGDYASIGEFSCHKNNTGSSWIIFGFAGTLEEWKQYLATKKAEGNPVTVQYILAEPVEYDLPQETIAGFKKLHTNYPNTIITNNADAGMELTYTVDTQSYIDGKIAEVSKAIL